MGTINDALNQSLRSAADTLRSAKTICILTGAGISAESGIPTFRDKQTGLWENYRAEDLANIGAFERNPKLVWSWYQWRRNLVKDKTPNPAHYALAKWQQHTPSLGHSIELITQNVDDLHEQAGSNVSHLHGHLWKDRCSQCGKPYDQQNDFENSDLITCKHCGGYIRPDIVWFGEGLPQHEWLIAEQAAETCDVFISIGTSSIVYPAAGLASLAKQNKATVIEVNPNPTPNPIVDIQIKANAGVALPELVKRMLN